MQGKASLLLTLVFASFFYFPANAQIQPFDENMNLVGEYLFKIKGSNTIGAHLAPNLVKQYMAAKGATKINIQETDQENEQIVSGNFGTSLIKVHVAAHGSGTGYKGLVSGDADIAASSRPAKSKEANLFSSLDLYSPNFEHVLAIDGLAVIVHPGLNLETLSIETVGQIFSSEITNWSELGGPDLEINVHARDNKSGTFDTFKSLVLKRGYKLTESAKRYESNDVLANTVATTPGAIGFTALANIGNAKALNISDTGASPLFPTKMNVATEDYPLARRLFFYSTNNSNPYAQEFINFALSAQGQNVVENIGFVSQDIISLKSSAADAMPAGYKLLSEQSQRLSVNFRFKETGYKLDNKALADVRRLKAFMDKEENRNKKLLLIGFSGQTENELRANVISELRVQKVRKALRELGLKAHAVTGYGDLNPVASNENEKYATKNHRVEVWIK